ASLPASRSRASSATPSARLSMNAAGCTRTSTRSLAFSKAKTSHASRTGSIPSPTSKEWTEIERSAQDLGVDDLGGVPRDDVEAGEVRGLERAAGVVSRDRVLDRDRAGLVVAHE